MNHVYNNCLSLVSAHLDDIKGASTDEVRKATIAKLESTFGKCKVEVHEFTFLGIEHVHNTVTFEVYTHQKKYISEPKPIPILHGKMADFNQPADANTAALYISLLGGISWVCQTRADIYIYVGFCQRHAKAPARLHIVILNKFLSWLQEHHSGIHYKKIELPTALYVISDSAFKAVDPDCLCVKADIIALGEYRTDKLGGNIQPWSLSSKKQARVTRSTFAAELGASTDASSSGILVMGVVTEILLGRRTAAQLCEVSVPGGNPVPLILTIDSKSFLDAVIATEVKVPSEKHLMHHVVKLREWLDNGAIDEIIWLDTRSMLCDGLTKGSVSRWDIMNAFNTGGRRVECRTSPSALARSQCTEEAATIVP